MNYYQLKITLKLKKDIYYDEVTEKLSILFNKSMLNSEYLKSIHEINNYKLYVFEGLSPFEKDKNYKCGNFYMTRLRCIDEFIADTFRKCLKATITNEFEVLAVDLDEIEFKPVKSLYNVTPAIATIDSEPWTSKMEMEVVKNSINNNLLKKIKIITGDEEILNHDMISSIEVKNLKPIASKYKSNRLIGNKFNIEIKEDNLSQLMAYIAISTGLLEKNSLGYGYCLYKNY